MPANPAMVNYVLPEILVALHREEPDIEIELVATDRDANLLQRSWVNYKNAT